MAGKRNSRANYTDRSHVYPPTLPIPLKQTNIQLSNIGTRNQAFLRKQKGGRLAALKNKRQFPAGAKNDDSILTNSYLLHSANR